MNILKVLSESPQKVITYTWISSLILLFITFLVMCVAVSHMSESPHDRVTAFAGAWTTLLFMIIAVVGSYFMSHFKSSASIGIFAGVVFIMSNQMLFVFAMFVERTHDSSDDHDKSASARSAQNAMAAFCFMMFALYAVFTGALVLFKDKVGSPSAASSSSSTQTEELGADNGHDNGEEDDEEEEKF